MLNLGPETEYVEHRKSTGEIKEGMQSIGSILNKHGRGTLYFGTLDNGDVIGQQVGKSTLRDVSQAVGNDIISTSMPNRKCAKVREKCAKVRERSFRA